MNEPIKTGTFADAMDGAEITRLQDENSRLSAQVSRLTEALGHYQHECDNCGHAHILHLHDGTEGECVSVDCYYEPCERYTNLAQQALREKKGDD